MDNIICYSGKYQLEFAMQALKKIKNNLTQDFHGGARFSNSSTFHDENNKKSNQFF